MRKNYFSKLVKYIKNVYHIERGLKPHRKKGSSQFTADLLNLSVINKDIHTERGYLGRPDASQAGEENSEILALWGYTGTLFL